MESDLSEKQKIKSLSYNKYKAKTLNEQKYISDLDFIFSNNLPSWKNNRNKLQEAILDLNFKKEKSVNKKIIQENIDLLKALVTQTEINEKNKLISEGKKILKKSNFATLYTKYLLEATEIFDKNQLKSISNDILNTMQENPFLAAGIMNKQLSDMSIRIAPSVIKSGKISPQFTFESIGKIFDKKIVKENKTYNYILNDNKRYINESTINGNSLSFNFIREIDKKYYNSSVKNTMNKNLILSNIINEISYIKPKKIELNKKSYSLIENVLTNILENNGYKKTKSDKKTIEFENEKPLDEMENWDFRIEDQDEKAEDGDLSPMSITMVKRPKTGMNETIKVKKKKPVKEEGLSPSDQKNVTAALGVLSGDLANNPSSKNTPATTAMDKLTAQEKDALRKSAPQSIDNSTNLGDLVTNVGTELSSKGDTIAKDLTGTNKNKEIIKPFGTEQNTTPNTNDIND